MVLLINPQQENRSQIQKNSQLGKSANSLSLLFYCRECAKLPKDLIFYAQNMGNDALTPCLVRTHCHC